MPCDGARPTLADAQSFGQTGSLRGIRASGEITGRMSLPRAACDPTTAPTLDLCCNAPSQERTFLERLLGRVSHNRQDGGRAPPVAARRVHQASTWSPMQPATRRTARIFGALMDVTDTRLGRGAPARKADLAHVDASHNTGECDRLDCPRGHQPLAAIVTNGEATLRWLANEMPTSLRRAGAGERVIRVASASAVIKRLRDLARKSNRKW